MKLDRRTLLVAGGTGVGLIVAFSLWPRHLESDLELAPGEQAFGAFIKIARDGRVTIAVPQAETGQGIWTGLAQIVADELGAAWDMIAAEPAPLAKEYANLLASQEGWPAGIRITANSTSVRSFERPMREAAAIARSMLIGAAADRWNVSPSSCDTADTLVISGVRTVPFGELAEEASSRSPPRSAPLRQSAKGRLIGQPLQRLDGPAKANGSWRFAGDVRLPSMLHAAARLAPPGGKLTGFSRAAIASMSGVRHVSANEDWIAIAADNWWTAEQALKAADPQFSGERTASDIRKVYEEALASTSPATWFSRGDYDGAVKGSRPLAATYFVGPTQHLGLEPLTATARVRDGDVELWAATLAPRFGHSYAGLYPMPPGEGAGRALEPDAAPIAIALARELSRPVQVTLSQASSQNHDRLSPGALAQMRALPGAGGITAAWSMTLASADGMAAALARLAGKEPPTKAGPHAFDGSVPPYSIPNVKIETVRPEPVFVAGYMRGSPEREFAFITESFIDELAHAAGMEPLAFRMSMLGTNPRLAQCFQSAAQLAGWDGGGAGSTMGIAGASAFGSHIALVASASIGEDERVKVHRLVAAVDCGRIINQGLVEQQIGAGLVWAIAQATIATPSWVAGMPRARPIGSLALPRLGDAPEIIVQAIASNDEPGGISALGSVPLAPALANALHAGSGKRLRSLPFNLANAA